MILLSNKDISKIERAIGIIEGVSCGVQLNLKTPLDKAIKIITDVVHQDMGVIPNDR